MYVNIFLSITRPVYIMFLMCVLQGWLFGYELVCSVLRECFLVSCSFLYRVEASCPPHPPTCIHTHLGIILFSSCLGSHVGAASDSSRKHGLTANSLILWLYPYPTPSSSRFPELYMCCSVFWNVSIGTGFHNSAFWLAVVSVMVSTAKRGFLDDSEKG